MKLSEVLPESAIRLDIDGHEKWHIIEVLTDSLVVSEQIDAGLRDEVHAALVAREKSMSTGMEKGIAIPHASVERVERAAHSLKGAAGNLGAVAVQGDCELLQQASREHELSKVQQGVDSLVENYRVADTELEKLLATYS